MTALLLATLSISCRIFGSWGYRSWADKLFEIAIYACICVDIALFAYIGYYFISL